MKTLRLTLVALTAGLVTLIAPTAATAVDYTEPVVNVSGGSGADGVVAPGEEFTVSGDFGGTECNPWVATFEGQTQQGSGTTFSVTFTAPTEPGTYFINLSCTYEDAAETSASVSKTVFFQAESTSSIRIVVGSGAGAGDGDNAGANESGLLPDTGGSNLLLLVAGGALVLLGAGLVAARRRKA